MEIFMIPIFGMLTGIFIVGIIFFFNYRVRVIEHKERLMAIEKGVALPEDKAEAVKLNRRPNRLFRGILCLFVGLGLGVALYYSGGPGWAVWGLFVAFIGLGYLTYWFIAERGRVTPELYDQEEKID